MQTRLPDTGAATDDKPYTDATADVAADITADFHFSNAAADADVGTRNAYARAISDSNADAGISHARTWKRLFSSCVRGCGYETTIACKCDESIHRTSGLRCKRLLHR